MSAQSPFTGAARILAALLEARTGQSLSESRAWRLDTELLPVMRANGLRDIDHLAATLVGGRDAALETAVVDALLNNESSFFRDLKTFDLLYREIMPHMRAACSGRRMRIWSAGCSTGQEAYSLAIRICNDAAQWAGQPVDILATDICASAVERARNGLYSQLDVQRGLSIGDLIGWFDQQGEDWRAKDQLRSMIDFRQDNLFDARVPQGSYDIILCRNVLLYFSPPRRQAVLRLLAQHSHPGTILMLGAGETVIGSSEDFHSHPDFRGAYVRVGQSDALVRRTA